MSAHDHKRLLRTRLRRTRRNITPAQRLQLDARLSQQLLAAPLLKDARDIAAYSPFDGEANPTLALDHWRENGRQLYLPVIPQKSQGSRMFFAAENNALERNHFGIRQPSATAGDAIDGIRLDVVLVPLVGFDRAGHRLGMGKGFYDEFLGGLTGNSNRPHFVGIGYACQETVLAPDTWDVRLDQIITESAIIDCR